MQAPIRKAVFPVAGLGTRFLPATKALPKEMLPVVDKPLIQYALEEAREAGIDEFIFVTGRGKSAIEDHFDHSQELLDVLGGRGRDDLIESLQTWMPKPGEVAYTRQQEALGLGHAIWCARHLVGDEPFAILLADDLVLTKTPCLKQLVEVYQEVGGNVVAVEDVPREETARYGVLDVGSDDGRLAEVRGLVEKPEPTVAPSTLSVIGRYLLMPEVFDYLGRMQKGAGGEIQLTDAMAELIGKAPFHGLRFEGRRFDCGSKLGFLQATIAFALARDELHDGLTEYLEEVVGATSG
ncbi:MAG: UTP--glucose-1-phosphate uridylyltransferase GalU [Alphaproteobacteria bacterium]|jgi:UTP--glucose-1-phosphate uridylyltransferase|nr:UTP--glucose-1-phosphate uridylyltransferase GalU [Alphaproteobacteria bacterium]